MAILIVGVATVVVEYSIIGHAFKELADEWVAGPGGDTEALLLMAAVMLGISGGLFHSYVAWMIGLPFSLLGVALVLEDHYPRWLSSFAVIAGAGAMLAGTTRFLVLASCLTRSCTEAS